VNLEDALRAAADEARPYGWPPATRGFTGWLKGAGAAMVTAERRFHHRRVHRSRHLARFHAHARRDRRLVCDPVRRGPAHSRGGRRGL